MSQIYGTMKEIYTALNRFCDQAFGASALGLPPGYGRPEESDEAVREGLYTAQRMAGVAQRNIGQVTHMVTNAALGLPADQGVPDVDIGD